MASSQAGKPSQLAAFSQQGVRHVYRRERPSALRAARRKAATRRSSESMACECCACDAPVNHVEDSDTLSVTTAVHLRPVAGARRDTPRRIHSIRLAITATARSERRGTWTCPAKTPIAAALWR